MSGDRPPKKFRNAGNFTDESGQALPHASLEKACGELHRRACLFSPLRFRPAEKRLPSRDEHTSEKNPRARRSWHASPGGRGLSSPRMPSARQRKAPRTRRSLSVPPPFPHDAFAPGGVFRQQKEPALRKKRRSKKSPWERNVPLGCARQRRRLSGKTPKAPCQSLTLKRARLLRSR